MMAAPTTCHHTEMLLKIANKRLEKIFASAVSAKIQRKMTNTRSSEYPAAHDSLNLEML
ncbi:unannotated protein [freshwater metagenome]|uniref:Unannotated protein n=1 Tax=freshwater metagenome TaxID=449393 RepID=A0A6J6TQU3_9ZZZZ